ncbi:cytochrome b [Vineibacter terrae]|uniref:Cytochrome b n=1 Tax=Vineibacter terrae TaxID=2586908 RepID=A0A5C8PVE8_9HYPH|nr:cytochrome b [Vineibacter terrae]TXL82197.1 cytochrome b [Vineibacter terrae]
MTGTPPPQPATASAYDPTAKALHWLTALLVIGMLGLGLWMVGLPISLQKAKVYSWHKWAGITVLALTLLRIVWRHLRPPPSLPGTLTPLDRRLAPWGHAALYALLLAMPLTGWTMSSAAGIPVVWFGVWQLPDLVGKDEALFKALQTTHHILSRLLIAVVVIHIAAVIRHDVLRRDGVLRRMLPFAR